MRIINWLYFVTVISTMSCKEGGAEVEAINACVASLIAGNSTNIVQGRMSNEYLDVRVRTFSATDKVVLSFGRLQSKQQEKANMNVIDDRVGIYCLVDGNGKVVALVSPETSGNSIELVEFVSDSESIETEALEDIDAAIASGNTVTVQQSTFSLAEGKITQVGQAQRVDVDGVDWSVSF